MTESEIIQLVRQIIRQELSPIAMGRTLSNETESLSTVQKYAIEPARAGIRTVMPYGFASKPPIGTQSLIVPMGNDPTNQITLGQYDPNRPPLKDGDVAIYDGHGNVLYFSQGKFQIGSEASAQPMVLGNQLTQLFSSLLDAIANHTHAGIGVPPTNAAAFEQLKASPVADGTILSKKGFTE